MAPSLHASPFQKFLAIIVFCFATVVASCCCVRLSSLLRRLLVTERSLCCLRLAAPPLRCFIADQSTPTMSVFDWSSHEMLVKEAHDDIVCP